MKLKDIDWAWVGSFIMLGGLIITIVFAYAYDDWELSKHSISIVIIGCVITAFGMLYNVYKSHVEFLELMKEYRDRYENVK